MKYLLGALFSIGMLSGAGADTGRRRTPTWYPLKVGTTWTYTYSGMDVTYTVTAKKKVGSVECAVVDVSYGGQVSTTQTVGRDGSGVHIYSAGMNGQDVAFDSPMTLLKLPLKKGQKWSWKGKYYGTDFDGEYEDAGEETLEVLGKKIACRKIVCKATMSAMGVDWTTWYAPDIGFVRAEYAYTMGGGGGGPMKMEMTLKEFKLGK